MSLNCLFILENHSISMLNSSLMSNRSEVFLFTLILLTLSSTCIIKLMLGF